MIDYTFSKPILQAVDDLIQFINKNPLNRKSIRTLFPHYYSNRNTIYSAFEVVTQKSVKEYRALKLMEAAAHLLTQRELTIRQIAYRCGYKGKKAASNFTRAFKKILKKTPKQWQRK
jgi:AraC-like DNA-binding protein